jgi:2-methylcitrate dehydratase PrpD
MEYQSGLSSYTIEWIHNVQYDDIPSVALHEAKRALLDTIGCGIAGQLTRGCLNIKSHRILVFLVFNTTLFILSFLSCNF